MKALWSSLEICPPTEHIDLPCHTVGELHSIGHFKVWGDTHKPHLGMVYLLVWVDDTSEAGNYGLAIVWISSCQARMDSMGEALELLSSPSPLKGLIGPTFSSNYMKGPTHTPLPKDRHVCVLPQGEAGSPGGQISQLKICRLLSDGAIGCLPHGVKWRGSVSDRLFVRIITHRFQHHYQRIPLHRG